MRLGILAGGLVEWLALRLNRVPLPLADGVFALMACRAVMAGVRLGLFAELARGEAPLDELAERLGVDRAALEALAAALVASGYLVQRGSRYALSAGARRWLDPASRRYVGNLIELNYDHWTWWAQLERSLATGRAVEIHETIEDPAAWRRYVLAMRDLARLVSGETTPRLPVPPGARRLLDVGGAHGEYSMALCRRHSGLTATVVDLPPVAAIGAQLVAAAGMGRRVEVRPGDATRDDLGDGYDVALAFQLLHHFDEGGRRRLLRRVVAALRPGGLLALLEPVRASRGDQFGALLNLHYLLTSRGGVFAPECLEGWLDDAGCVAIRRYPLRSAPGLLLLTGRRREVRS